jgi:hypothetical protein
MASRRDVRLEDGGGGTHSELAVQERARALAGIRPGSASREEVEAMDAAADMATCKEARGNAIILRCNHTRLPVMH